MSRPTSSTEQDVGMDPRLYELQKLKKEYKQAEKSRKEYAEESHAVLRKQQATIDKLKRENDKIKSDVSLILRSNSGNKNLNFANTEKLNLLTEQAEKYSQTIEIERRNLDSLTQQIELLREKAQQQRKLKGGESHSYSHNTSLLRKQIHLLEDRLHNTLTKLHQNLETNKNLKNEIDALKKEKIINNNLYKKYDKNLSQIKKKISNLMEVSNSNYEERDRIIIMINNIEELNRKELKEYEEQMTIMNKLLEEEFSFKNSSVGNLSSTILHSSSSASLHEKSSPIKHKSSRSLAQSQSMSLLNQTPSPNKLKSSNSLDHLSTDPSATSSSNPNSSMNLMTEIDYKERANIFELAFEKIKNSTGINNIDELLSNYIKNEEKNYSLFNYVNNQYNEIELLNNAILELEENKLKYINNSNNNLLNHKELINNLDSKLNYLINLNNKYNNKCSDIIKILEVLKKILVGIFQKIENYEEVLLKNQSIDSSEIIKIADYNENYKENYDEIIEREEKEKLNKAAANATSTTASISSDPSIDLAESSTKDSDNKDLVEYDREKDKKDKDNKIIISDSNMIYYLSLLEVKSMKLLQHYRQLEALITTNTEVVQSHLNKRAQALADEDSQDDDGSFFLSQYSNANDLSSIIAPNNAILGSLLGTGPRIPMGTEHLHVNPPKSDDYKEDDSEDDEDDNNFNTNISNNRGSDRNNDPNGNLNGTNDNLNGNQLDSDSDEDINVTRPLTREELKMRTFNRLQKKQLLVNTISTLNNSSAAGVSSNIGGTNSTKQLL